MAATIHGVMEEIKRLHREDVERHQARLMHLCSRHPKARGAVAVVHNGRGPDGREGLSFRYADGSSDGFRILNAARVYCGRGLRRDTDTEVLNKAARRAVQDQVDAYRGSLPPDLRRGHVDHDNSVGRSFAQLLCDWRRDTGWGSGQRPIGVRCTPQAGRPCPMPEMDEGARRSWCDYHRAHARLRMMEPAANNAERVRVSGRLPGPVLLKAGDFDCYL